MKLVKKYDSHGRNCITFEEFQGFLVSRSALNSGEAPSSPSAGPLRLPHQVPHRAPSAGTVTAYVATVSVLLISLISCPACMLTLTLTLTLTLPHRSAPICLTSHTHAGSTPPSRHRAAAPYADSPHTPPAAGKVSEKYNKGAPFATDNNNSAYSEGSADEPDAYADDEVKKSSEQNVAQTNSTQLNSNYNRSQNGSDRLRALRPGIAVRRQACRRRDKRRTHRQKQKQNNTQARAQDTRGASTRGAST